MVFLIGYFGAFLSTLHGFRTMRHLSGYEAADPPDPYRQSNVVLCLHKLQNPLNANAVGAKSATTCTDEISWQIRWHAANVLLGWIISLLRNIAKRLQLQFCNCNRSLQVPGRESAASIDLRSSSATRKFKFVITRYSRLGGMDGQEGSRAGGDESAIQPHSRGRSRV